MWSNKLEKLLWIILEIVSELEYKLNKYLLGIICGNILLNLWGIATGCHNVNLQHKYYNKFEAKIALTWRSPIIIGYSASKISYIKEFFTGRRHPIKYIFDITPATKLHLTLSLNINVQIMFKNLCLNVFIHLLIVKRLINKCLIYMPVTYTIYLLQ